MRGAFGCPVIRYPSSGSSCEREGRCKERGQEKWACSLTWKNIRYSFLNVYQIEPNVAAFIEKAKKHGRVSVAMAYADFNEHPQWVRRGLDVAGIAARDIPVRRFVRDGQERLKSSADLHMLMDIMETALDRPQVTTYVLMTGDSDYIRVIAWIKNRFDKRVIICGVPGTISTDLVAAAGESDHLEASTGITTDALLGPSRRRRDDEAPHAADGLLDDQADRPVVARHAGTACRATTRTSRTRSGTC